MSDLLNAVHETTKGLHQAGIMDAKTMHEFDLLCLPEVKRLSPDEIKGLRLRCKTSQSVFAAFLNVSPSTVQKWESGQKSPNGPSMKLLNLVSDKGLEVLT